MYLGTQQKKTAAILICFGLGVALLAKIPLDPALAAGGDAGEPVAGGDSAVAEVFGALAGRLIDDAPDPIEMTGCSARLLELLDQAVTDG